MHQVNNSNIEKLFVEGLELLPSEVIDSHGMPMDISGPVLQFNTSTTHCVLDLSVRGITNPFLDYSLRRYLAFSLRRISPIECYNSLRLNTLYMSKTESWNALRTSQTLEDHERNLNSVMAEILAYLRKRSVMYGFSRVRSWYIWCADFIPELGFDSDEAYKWQMIHVPGNRKGVAVSTLDPEGGPLNDTELILLINAIKSDDSLEPDHVEQKAATMLALAYGRNPANYALLRRGDLINVLEGESESIWVLRIPRIKKRTLPRQLFKEEYVSPELAKILLRLVKNGEARLENTDPDAPMFARARVRRRMQGAKMEEWKWHVTSSEFTALIQAASVRYGLISPRTGQPLFLTSRRLRYTFATNRVREGVSAIDLAEALDHSDLQNVRVYFDARSTVVERLDRAAAGEIAAKIGLFKGRIVDGEEAKTLRERKEKLIRIIPELMGKVERDDLGACGQDERCNLSPPLTCYGCSRFKPFKDSLELHEMVLDYLLSRRERLRTDPAESDRIAVQLDEVIYACIDVVEDIRNGSDSDAQIF